MVHPTPPALLLGSCNLRVHRSSSSRVGAAAELAVGLEEILTNPCHVGHCQRGCTVRAATVGVGRALCASAHTIPSAGRTHPSLPLSDGCWGRPLPRRTSCPGTHPSVAPAAPRTAPLSSQSNKIEKAVSAAHTFLQKNPKHEMTLKYLNYYRTMVDVDEYLVDLEAQPYEVRRR